MPKVDCRICEKSFYIKPSHQRLGYGKYCSIACRSESQKRGRTLNCEVCGKETWKSPKDLMRSKSGLFFCSKSCQTRWRNMVFSGENHSNWRCGEASYRQRLISSRREIKCDKCGITDLRVLSAHHIDKDRDNNELTNLKWLCLNCHHLEHGK